MTVQDQVIAARVIEAKVMHESIPSLMCRVCGTAEEAIVQLLAACPTLATTAYLHCHNLVAVVIHWHLMRFYDFQLCMKSWYCHKPLLEIEYPIEKISWDFSLITNYYHSSNRPGIVFYNFCEQKIFSLKSFVQPNLMFCLKRTKRLTSTVPLQQILSYV